MSISEAPNQFQVNGPDPGDPSGFQLRDRPPQQRSGWKTNNCRMIDIAYSTQDGGKEAKGLPPPGILSITHPCAGGSI
ncbi:hypothetical protein J6590_003268 [Homalodisca vitripennis]|nr:hypothetical protein J6590_003268 [Homalodisca vitripennis]